jgi:hypothetical protein
MAGRGTGGTSDDKRRGRLVPVKTERDRETYPVKVSHGRAIQGTTVYIRERRR